MFVYKQFPLPVSSQLTASCGLESVDWWSSTALGREGTGRDKCLLGLQLVGTRTYNFSFLIYRSFGLFSCKINLPNEATIIITPITSFVCQQTCVFVWYAVSYTLLCLWCCWDWPSSPLVLFVLLHLWVAPTLQSSYESTFNTMNNEKHNYTSSEPELMSYFVSSDKSSLR